jgi:dsDNA-specific endonuclease/ATPase MutS2
MPDPRSIEQPLDGTLDLHTFQPGEVKDLVPEYLSACRERGITQVRIIHGKGSGTLRHTVESVLSKLPYVESFRTAEEGGGGWGATIVTLQKN